MTTQLVFDRGHTMVHGVNLSFVEPVCTADTTPGSTLLLAAAVRQNIVGPNVSVDDHGVGNVYVLELAGNALSHSVYLFRCFNAVKQPAGAKITIVFSGASATDVGGGILELTNTDAVDVTDSGGSNVQAGSTPLEPLQPFTTTAPNAALISVAACVGANGTYTTVTGGNAFLWIGHVAGANFALAVIYQLLSATGTFNDRAFHSVASAWASCTAAYKQTIPPPPPAVAGWPRRPAPFQRWFGR